MFKKILASLALCMLSITTFATTIPGESAFCINNCLNGVCSPVVTTLGAVNYSIGVPLAIYDPNTRMFQEAYFYQWAQSIPANGTPTNLGGLSSDTSYGWTFGVVQGADAGLYTVVGYTATGSLAFNWCVTVN